MAACPWLYDEKVEEPVADVIPAAIASRLAAPVPVLGGVQSPAAKQESTKLLRALERMRASDGYVRKIKVKPVGPFVTILSYRDCCCVSY